MPALPEFARVAGRIRQIKIDHQVNAQAPGQAAGDIRVGVKVAEDLKREGIERGQDHRSVGAAARGKDRVHNPGQQRGDKHFFKQSPGDEVASLDESRERDPAGIQDLRQQVPGAFNRSGDELGKKGHVEGKVPKMRSRPHASAVDINGVA